ncbi:MAG: Hsp20/alpha crystallin family protein [Flavobacteriales bacterium]|nr:Hsp20/alpha crystallin family protein [Flavobacteriales bacterium]
MTLVKYRPSRSATFPVDRLASEIFGSNIGRFFGSDGFPEHAPRVNIVEGNTDFRVEVQAPGFDKKDLKVEMLEDTLTIRGEHTTEDNTEEERYTRREFSRSSFERSFMLPKSVKGDAIKADYVNGVLKLTIPKMEESKPKTRSIDIG